MWQNLGIAIALLLVLEGLLPFISPERLRKTMLMMSQLNDQTLRFIGLTSMVLGLLLLNLLR